MIVIGWCAVRGKKSQPPQPHVATSAHMSYALGHRKYFLKLSPLITFSPELLLETCISEGNLQSEECRT